MEFIYLKYENYNNKKLKVIKTHHCLIVIVRLNFKNEYEPIRWLILDQYDQWIF
jgi:hypothetical protein